MSQKDGFSRSLNTATMTLNTQKVQELLKGFKLQSIQQHMQAELDLCRCKDSMNIFERLVEDQYLDVWYSDIYGMKSKVEKEEEACVRKDNYNNGQYMAWVGSENRKSANMVHTDLCVIKSRKSNYIVPHICGTSGSLHKQGVCNRCHKPNSSGSSSHSEYQLGKFSSNQPRKNSIILKLSSHKTRQSFLDSSAAGLCINGEAANLDEIICGT